MIKAYSWLTLCVVIWGSNFVFGKMLIQYFSPTMLTELRLFFIVLFLVGLAAIKKEFRRVNKIDLMLLFVLGVVGVFINQWSFFAGLQTADPTTAALILATTPILAGVLAALFLKEKFTIRMLIGSVIAIVGIYFVVTKGEFVAIAVDSGLLWIVVTMVTFAIMIIMTRVLSKRVSPLTITLYSNIIGFAVGVPFIAVLDHPIRVSTDLSDWTFLIVTAIVVHGIAALIWNQNIRYVDASKASILSNLEPFVAMLMGLILLYKPVTKVELMGSLLIIGGVVLSTFQRNIKVRSE